MKHYRDFTTAEKCILAAQEINRLQMVLEALWQKWPGDHPILAEITRIQLKHTLDCIKDHYEHLKHMPEEDAQ